MTIERPMFPPVDPTRRRFLTVAAVGSIVGAGSLAFAAAAPNDVPQAVTNASPNSLQRDPMFGMIEAHRKADRDHEAALDEQERLERIGDHAAADLAGEASCHAAFKAFDALLSAAATSRPAGANSWRFRSDLRRRGLLASRAR